MGTQAKKAGAIQADMLQNAWKENQKKLDHNKNNTLDYILIEGEQTHFDSIRRTNGFLESSQNRLSISSPISLLTGSANLRLKSLQT